MFASLNRDEKYVVLSIFYIFVLLGLYALVVGCILPMLREEYGVSYEFGGLLISINAVGNFTMSIVASYTAIYFGLKNAYWIQHTFVIFGFALLAVSGRPVALMAGMLLMGLARGAVGNYSNQIVNDMTRSNSRAMNLLGVFFAVGACAAPLLVMLFTRDGGGGWKYALGVSAVASAAGIALTLFMKIDNSMKRGREADSRLSMAFFRDKVFWVSVGLLFSYTSVETSIIGWISSYFLDIQPEGGSWAQSMSLLVWVSLLAGRVACSAIANRLSTASLLLGLSIGTAAFFALLMAAGQGALLFVASVGLGFFMSGIYSTVIANAGHIFSRYRLAFGFYITISGIGAIIMPSVVGVIAEGHGIQSGIKAISVCVATLVLFSIWNVFLKREGPRVVRA
ncbi:MAG: MFS transporter [Clostridiales Family XIII bacterium]|jgi:fucose permease|nr:MFS transporter [Clostridiales Family XIII bacterium]